MRPTSARRELVWALVLKATAVEHGARPSIKTVERNPAGERFAPQASGGPWLLRISMMYRRLVRECAHRIRSSESRVSWAMTAVSE
ncbi:hypothetical protein ABWJ92_35625 [Streptomyces sp. NPDC000609]|uniref:hypothetical protein n=1 Tax=Streptomyces sp. NPDC000609 TaxID=3160957 RepID=UPI0033944F37